MGYEYRYKAGSGSFTAWANVPGSNVNTTSYTVTGLVNGTTHTFEVRARTATLKGAAASDTATPMAVAPDAPSITTVAPRDEALLVSWSVADDGGSAITEYQVQWKSGSQSFDTTRRQAGINRPIHHHYRAHQRGRPIRSGYAPGIPPAGATGPQSSRERRSRNQHRPSASRRA